MIRTQIDSAQFHKDLQQAMEYSIGFLEGVKLGKTELLASIGVSVKEILENYIDSNARVNPAALHHVYEWYQTGSPEARLYDISFTISNLGLSFKTSFSQSESFAKGSYEPFRNKAAVMEEGQSLTVKPKNSRFLKFKDESGEDVYTSNPVRIENPGGTEVQGSFERVFDEFFARYFTQSFLQESGIAQYLKNPVAYKKNIVRSKRGGKALGKTVGYRWVANAGVGR